jgi:hypothetical protein
LKYCLRDSAVFFDIDIDFVTACFIFIDRLIHLSGIRFDEVVGYAQPQHSIGRCVRNRRANAPEPRKQAIIITSYRQFATSLVLRDTVCNFMLT